MIAAATASVLRTIYLAAEVAHQTVVADVLCDTVRLAAVASNIALRELGSTISSLAQRLLPSDLFNLFVIDAPSNDLLCVESTYRPFTQVLRLGEGVSFDVATTNTLLRVNDGSTHPAVNRRMEILWGNTIRNMLRVPVQRISHTTSSKMIAVIEVRRIF